MQYFEKPDIDEEHYQQSLSSAKEIKQEAMKAFYMLFIEVSKLDERIMGLDQQAISVDTQNDTPQQ